ncbi:MAG: alpha/beta hydrolase [Clostridia bacterium]|nr:alpha/beta hydrolase [Clostridia bacterium]
MITETYHLSKTNPDVTLTAYIADTYEGAHHRAVLVIPGGGYRLCAYREGEPYALEFLARGYCTFVLHYSVMGAAYHPTQLIEASAAMKLIKDNAEHFYIDPNSVFVIGSSAGGHLAAMLGTMWNDSRIYDAVDMPFGYNKPVGMILCYPVISSGEKAHVDSFRKLLGEKFGDEQAMKEVSLEYRVTENTVPAFIWHTATDNCVPVENSLMFAQALAEKKIPFELHVFPSGSHGMSLCQKNLDSQNEYNAAWIRECEHWMDTLDPISN